MKNLEIISLAIDEKIDEARQYIDDFHLNSLNYIRMEAKSNSQKAAQLLKNKPALDFLRNSNNTVDYLWKKDDFYYLNIREVLGEISANIAEYQEFQKLLNGFVVSQNKNRHTNFFKLMWKEG